ncbi:MAG TPA: polysaccharide deacetylase family protein [Bacteroidales bacterium]|nr:polysaccharide deacetylase family protein [Bacteroidales bacterium]HPF03983.1 polysaccharide deacetylase family protein [Bacteroidales bacterium]HPJ58522.1 polysaccharide deacetylase family protein [Bacteroidales bacterium]HPR11697.1 polysaccharide deacetylase family protein [Bacteroidales bacterium]HRW85532.1 polysaccharide deacetylase family protein [Bacteroidales bacterium]
MAARQVKIYVSNRSPRLNYIAGIILGDILGLSWDIVTDKRRIGKDPVINYSDTYIAGSFKITPAGILFEKGIDKKHLNISVWRKLPIFYQTDGESDLPFDIFAASFYMVTRYEEYSDHQTDEHGRFRAASSMAFSGRFLDKPVVDLWTREFARALLGKYPGLVFRKNNFSSIITIDSDQPFAYLGKNFLTGLGGFIRDAAVRRKKAFERYKVLFRGKQDPYYVFDYIMEAISKYGTPARFFFPAADYSEYDKNPSWKSQEYRNLIGKAGSRYGVGIHPSYFAAENPALLGKEIRRLVSITGESVTSSRYHYLRISFPSSFRELVNLGIVEDFSLGYHDEPGFRAGIARPFFFYDVTEDVHTNLKIIPFQVMDGTLFQYKKLDPVSSWEIIGHLINETKQVGGLFVSIWHNTSLLDTPEWKEWREVFDRILKTCMQ